MKLNKLTRKCYFGVRPKQYQKKSSQRKKAARTLPFECPNTTSTFGVFDPAFFLSGFLSVFAPIDITGAETVDAFAAIERDPNNELVVATLDDSIIGVLQLTYIPNLTHVGSWRGMIEGVRVSSSHRSAGVGTGMLQWAIERCRSRACRLVQLTSDLQRSDSIAFYEQLGFQHSHAGMKLRLE